MGDTGRSQVVFMTCKATTPGVIDLLVNTRDYEGPGTFDALETEFCEDPYFQWVPPRAVQEIFVERYPILDVRLL